MKKAFCIAAACCLMAVSAAFISCDPNKTQCWKITVEFQTGQTEEYYFWGDGMESDAQLDQYGKLPGIKRVSKVQTFMSQSDCHK